MFHRAAVASGGLCAASLFFHRFIRVASGMAEIQKPGHKSNKRTSGRAPAPAPYDAAHHQLPRQTTSAPGQHPEPVDAADAPPICAAPKRSSRQGFLVEHLRNSAIYRQ